MTNHQLTKEWLQQTIAELESVRDEIPFGIDTNSELELAAFKIALAALDSEPVKRVNADQMHRVCLEANRHLDKYVAMAKEVNKLLGRTPAQQAPVVPEEKPMPNTLSMYAVDAVAAIAEVRGWNACRTTMLQAGNSPVIPEGYVMVPKEPTEAMINAWLSEVANWRGHVAGYEAMLAAAQQEVK